jgi:glucose-6-phosphate dehydrogenase assembly protein OpcA
MTAGTPEQILKELSKVWASLGKDQENGVLRACTMTLILAADEEEEVDLGEFIAGLMHEHPSRAIVLKIRDGQDEFLESRVFAQCWMPLGKNQQLCCEQIEIQVSEGSLGEVPRLVVGLMAPDLPVVLVCRTPALFGLTDFKPLVPVAGRTIVDSRLSGNPGVTLGQVQSLRDAGYDVRDLAWTALTGWRQRIASAFDSQELLAKLPGVRLVRIQGSAPKMWYLGAWLRRGFGKAVDVKFEPGQGIDSVEIFGEGIELEFARTTTCTELPDIELLRQELSFPARDRIYEEVLPGALELGRH